MGSNQQNLSKAFAVLGHFQKRREAYSPQGLESRAKKRMKTSYAASLENKKMNKENIEQYEEGYYKINGNH